MQVDTEQQSLEEKLKGLTNRNEIRTKILNFLSYLKYVEKPAIKLSLMAQSAKDFKESVSGEIEEDHNKQTLIFIKTLNHCDLIVDLTKCTIYKRKEDKEYQFEGLFITSFMKILGNFEDKNLFNNLLTVVQASNSDKITDSLFEAFKQKLRSFEKEY